MEQDAGARVYRRRIRLESPGQGLIFGALEDTAHHVRVTLAFEGNRVRSVTGEAVRLPWATCPGAAAGLAQLQGTTVTSSLTELRHRYDRTTQCTHFFDLAQLTLAHAARGGPGRSYEAVASVTDGTTMASLTRDGQTVLSWTVRGGLITEPEFFSGVGLAVGFVRWCAAHLDDEGAEAAFVLRRASSMAGVAGMRLDDYAVVADSGLPVGTCFTAQPENMTVAYRNVGSQRDYSARSEEMLDGFDEASQQATN